MAGYVEHAFGAWHPRGGLYELVRALVRRLEALGGRVRLAARVEQIVVRAGGCAWLATAEGTVAADAVVAEVDESTMRGRLLPALRSPQPRERSLSGLALLLGLHGGPANQPIT